MKLRYRALSSYGPWQNTAKVTSSFFYALLVIAKNDSGTQLDRYVIKHYVFCRNDDTYYEVPPANVKIVEAPLVWPTSAARAPSHSAAHAEPDYLDVHPGRVADRDTLGELYKGFRSFSSQKLGFYWRGQLELVDGSEQEILLLEDKAAKRPSYSIALREPHDALKHAAEDLAKLDFPSARLALVTAERTLNRALFGHSGARRRYARD